MKNIGLYIILFLFNLNYSFAQHNLSPISIDCWSLNQNDYSNLAPNFFENYSCFVTPGNNNVSLTGNKEVNLRAGKEIHLKPGFSVSNLNGNGNFHAELEPETVSVVVFTPIDTWGKVSKCDKLELGLKLSNDLNNQIENYFSNATQNYLNPFDPEQISIEAKFTHYPNASWMLYNPSVLPPSITNLTSTRMAYGFYYEEYHVETNSSFPDGNWVQDTTSFNFRVRFSPNKVGYWRVEIIIKVNNQITHILKPIFFECTPSSKPGFLLGGETALDERHFEFENGDVFFGIGQAIAWPDKQPHIMPPGYGAKRDQPPAGYTEQRNYILDLSNNGGNLVRIINGEWTDALEWEKLGDYKAAMPFAWEFDRTFDLLTDREVYLLWCLQTHTAFGYHNPFGDDGLAWPGNPYNIEMGLANPEVFFSDLNALKIYKRKIRYMLSRWGYSPQIAAIQLFNEINDAAFDENYHPYRSNSSFRNTVNNWFTNLKSYIQNELGYDFNIGSSFTSNMEDISDNNSILSDADFNDWHPYSNQRNRNIGGRWGGLNDPSGYGIIIKNNKPAIIGENGMSDPIIHDCGEVDWHNDIWASSMMGGWATGLPWWIWRGQHNTRSNFYYLKNFFSNIDFKYYKWIPQRWPNSQIEAPNYSSGVVDGHVTDNYFEALYMVGDLDFQNYKRAFGWVHNRSSYWYNKKTICEDSIIQNGFEAPTDDDNYTVETLQTNGDNRIIRLENMSNLQQYAIDWFDPATGSHLTTTYDTDFALGRLKVNIPADINSTQYRDLVFMLRPEGSSFLNPFIQNMELQDYSDLDKKGENQFFLSDNWSLMNKDSINAAVFPNPGNGILRLNVNKAVNRVEIFDVFGKLIYSQLAHSSDMLIDISNNSKGVYIIRVFSDQNNYCIKYVKN